MANIKSAKTRIKHNLKRKEINSNRLNAVRTQVKKTQKAIATGDKEGAKESLKKTESLLARGGQKGALKKKTASRKISRLVAAVKKMFA